ncbi:Uncharacterized protein BP5553_00803 [Venustampulla echinocandica]|uniref:TLC domain-containing protein n=1 Tax=Venustampulla echinocandica TaxID=2656787 RepID=A0A370TZ88_9HELO|nr:Uncharacterized protein BP5553_00803 [Venustampulla echinocandica]RDL40824.1 Uncharacterized protein BP5553_00803 [Venustampulla echinocandica]
MINNSVAIEDPKRIVEVEMASESSDYHCNGDNLERFEEKLHPGPPIGFESPPMFTMKKAKRKDDGPLDIFCSWVVEHQIGLSLNLFLLLTLTHLSFPRARRHTRKFFELSYFNSESGEYCAGWNDAWMVLFWIVVFTGLRAAVMDYILMPFAKKGGVKTQRDQTRFAEQAWLIVYYCCFFPLGMYILVNSDYWLNLKNLWVNFPNREMTGLVKWYILVQYAFWLQQIMVINIEERRKDHWQMFTHHIVTTMLIFTSYGYHQTKVANMILCVMDSVDIFLSVGSPYTWKLLACDFAFAFFLLVWIGARHVVYLTICYSIWADLPVTIGYGCYRGKKGAIEGPFPPPDRFGHLLEPFRDPKGVVCFNDNIKSGFLGALLFLQVITIMWFVMICRVALQVIRGGQADDTRSDDEGEEEEEIEDERHAALEQMGEKVPQPYEEEVGVEAINLRGRTSNASRYRKGTSSATGVSLPSDTKELLGRIGCDKSI